MLNERKIKIMTQLAKYEKAENRDNFLITNFYKWDYIRYNVMKTIVSITIGYALILGMIALYQAEYLIANAVTLDYGAIGAKILGIYLLLVLLYGAATVISCFIRYDKSRRYIGRYFKTLDMLRKFYSSEAEQK